MHRIRTKVPKKTYSFRLSKKHNSLINASAELNSCTRTEVLEDMITKYYKL